MTNPNSRNEQIYRLHFEDQVSLSELARRFQMSQSGVCKVLRVEKARRPAGEVPSLSAYPSAGQSLGEPVSRRHRAIGQKLKWWREEVRKIGVRQAAIELDISAHRLRAVEEGAFAEVGLALLQRLAAAMNIDLDDFLSETLKPPHEWTRPKG